MENLRARLLATLRIKLTQQGQTERLQKKLAFEKLITNRQHSMMEQLLTDNENLMDQIQGMQS